MAVEIMKWALAVFCVCLALFGLGTLYFAFKGAIEAKPESKRPDTLDDHFTL